MSAVEVTDDVARLTRERDEARAYLKAFVYATIDPEDRRADVQVHQANPSLGWIFTLNDTGMRGQREILGSQIRRAMEIVGFDKLKIDAPETTVADDHIAACRRTHEAQERANENAARADMAEVSAGQLVRAGKHLAVKLAEVYRAAGRSPAECQAIRDWMAAIAKAESR